MPLSLSDQESGQVGQIENFCPRELDGSTKLITGSKLAEVFKVFRILRIISARSK